MSSTGYKFKKNVASKVAESTIGRKLIMQYVGPAGNEIVRALKVAAIRNADKTKAKRIKQTAYKMALKVKLMDDERLVQSHEWLPLITQWHSLVPSLLEALNPESKEADLEEINTRVGEIHGTCQQIMGNHMTEKNQDLLKEAVTYLGSMAFLNDIIKNGDYEEEKKILYSNLNSLINMTAPPTVDLDQLDDIPPDSDDEVENDIDIDALTRGAGKTS